MYESDFDEHEWLDEELRRIPTPEGLIQRLKLIGDVEDAQIDMVVREAVMVPEGLTQRLKSIPGDEKLDRQLRDVEVPASLAASLRAVTENHVVTETHTVTETSPTAVVISESETESAQSTATRLRSSASTQDSSKVRSGSWWSRIRKHPDTPFTAAAGLLIAVGLWAFLGGGLTGGDEEPSAEQVAESRPKVIRRNDHNPPKNLRAPSTDPNEAEAVVSNPQNKPEKSETPRNENPFGLAIESKEGENASNGLTATDPLPEGGRDLPTTLDQIVAFGGANRTPRVETVRGLGPLGFAPPSVKEFDRIRFLREGVHPFVSPKDHPDLEKTLVPLRLDTYSFDLLRDYLAQGRMPATEDIRPEDFLAAVDYDFPRPAFDKKVGLIAAGGPSPFRSDRLQLLQLGVQTSDLAQRKLPPSELVIAVDVTPGIAGQRRLETVRRALTLFYDWFERGDRITVVPLTTKTRTLIDRAGEGNESTWREALKRLNTHTSSDLAGGFANAAALVSREDSHVWRRNVVAVLGDLDDYSADELQALEAVVKASAAQRVHWDVVRMDNLPSVTDDESKSKTAFQRLALSGGGVVHSAQDSQGVLSALTEILTGSSRLVAKQARLSVRFNPEVVARYRLIGHEASQVTLQSPGKLEIDLHTGQSATALFELQLRPTGGSEVAQAELSWNDAETGEAARLTQRISRVQFAISKYESPLSLQMAAIISEAAEVLRGSPFAESHRQALRDVLAESEHVSTRLRSNQSFVEFLTVIQQAHQRRVGAAASPSGAPTSWLPKVR